MERLSLVKYGTLFLTLVSLSSCIATLKDDNATLAYYQQTLDSTVTATTGIGAFEQTFYPFARQNCVQCHGSTQAPLFAVADPNASYAAVDTAQYVNFNSPSTSEIAVYAGNGHCGVSGCQGNSATVTQLVTEWAAVELAPASGSGGAPAPVGGAPATGGASSTAYITPSLAIPASVENGTTTATTYVPMRWQLSQLAPTNAMVAGAIFEIEVQQLSATAYRVRNPKIAGLKAATQITGVHVFVKETGATGIGVEDIGAGNVWATDVVTVAASTLPATLPATPLSTTTYPPLDTFAMVIGILSSTDSFTISFDGIGTPITITPTFASISANILVPQCVACHSAANAQGGYAYDTYASTIKSVSTSSATVGNPSASALYTSVTGTPPAMPQGGTALNSAATSAISTWITGGAPNN